MLLLTFDKPLVIDIGGEGRHVEAWNINPSPCRTIGPDRGQPIPRWIFGRADNIPLPSASVDWLIVERTPLSKAALQEIARVISPAGRITLRHAAVPRMDPHALAKAMLPGQIFEQMAQVGGVSVRETEFQLEIVSS